MIPSNASAFTDAQGRAWSCKVTVSTLERCRESGGYDPLAFIHSGELWKGVIDPVLIADLVWHSIEPDAINIGVSKSNFKDALSGEVIEQARDAWFAAFAAFLPPRMGEALQADKAGIEERITSALKTSPEDGGRTSTAVQDS